MRHSLAVVCGAVAVAVLAAPPSAPAATEKPPGTEAWMIRMLACEGEGAKMELYLPEGAVGDIGVLAYNEAARQDGKTL